ncbi:MAG: hypothetical protein IRY98_01200 [Alicyclobacillaceae bacterium]|nr:hypothetical protein [Alicyclobacillaceae bacterium]
MDSEVLRIPLLPGVRGIEIDARSGSGEVCIRPLYHWNVPGEKTIQAPDAVAGVYREASRRRFGISSFEMWRRMRHGQRV